MPARPSVKPYCWLAQYYDAFFSPMRTPIARARNHILGPILPRVQSACDLCCGTGDTALELARRGIRMFAVDQSPQMCRLTREKAADSGLPIRVLRADMRTFRLPEPVDLITCEFDALNHLSQRSNLALVARTVGRALHPGGYFFFDVNNALAFQTYWKGDFCLEIPGVVMVMRNTHRRQSNRANVEVECFIREGRLWRRHTERVEEVCWSPDEIRRALARAGLGDLHAWDAAPFFGRGTPVGPGCRTIYLARKQSDSEPASASGHTLE
jgi:SAM-dependent methyltransferase